MSQADNEEWELHYDLECWHCRRFHEEPQCKGKMVNIKSCVSYEPREDEVKKNGRGLD